MTALPGRPLRRILLSTAATVAGVPLLLSLKPHTTAAIAAAAPAPPPASSGTAQSSGGTAAAGGGTATGGSGSGSTSSGGSSSGSSRTSGGSGTSGSSSGSGSSGGSGTSKGSGSGKSTATRTVAGDTVQTQYGPVQLQITVSGGRLTAVKALQVPDQNPRDQEIASFAVPQLTQEALSAQSAKIDAVSGATYTSAGYVQSLQSALDKAGI